MVPAIAGGTKIPLELIFPEELVKEPVIYELSKNFDIIFNIRRAKVTEKYGELVIELEGDEKTIDAAIEWLKQKNIKVNPVIKNSIA
ncbi:MAG: NIL domain-containing protein [bacterium]|nr:NIL domain-containing protein [bacterium]